jgi:hypothetical protein
MNLSRYANCRKWALLSLSLMVACPSIAEPPRGAPIDYLSNRPASLLDIGVLRGQRELDRLSEMTGRMAQTWTSGHLASISTHIWAGASSNGTILSMTANLAVDKVVPISTCQRIVAFMYETILDNWQEWFLPLGTYGGPNTGWRKDWLTFEKDLFAGIHFSCRCLVAENGDRIPFRQYNYEEQCSVRNAKIDDIYQWNNWAAGRPGRIPGELWEAEK